MEEAQEQWKDSKNLLKISNRLNSQLKGLIDQIMDELDIVDDQKQEKEVNNLKTKLSRLNKQLAMMEKNYSYVENAIISYNSAAKKLKDASEHKRWRHIGGARTLVHYVKDSDVTEAQTLVNRGNRHLFRAVEELKGSPKFQYAEVKKAGFWSGILFDGVLYGSDAYNKVLEAITSVNKALQTSKSVAERYEAILNPLSTEIKDLDKKYSNSSKLLEKERITIIEAFIAKNS